MGFIYNQFRSSKAYFDVMASNSITQTMTRGMRGHMNKVNSCCKKCEEKKNERPKRINWN